MFHCSLNHHTFQTRDFTNVQSQCLQHIQHIINCGLHIFFSQSVNSPHWESLEGIDGSCITTANIVEEFYNQRQHSF